MTAFATTPRRPAPTPIRCAGAAGQSRGSATGQQPVVDASSDQTNLVTGAWVANREARSGASGSMPSPVVR